MMIEVVAAFLVQTEKVLIARRRAPSQLAGKWEFPGGKVEAGETPEESLAREMEEEFGIRVAVGPFVADSFHHQAKGSFHIRAYRATWLSGQLVPVAHDRCAWAGPGSLLSYDLLPADVDLARALIKSDILNTTFK